MKTTPNKPNPTADGNAFISRFFFKITFEVNKMFSIPIFANGCFTGLIYFWVGNSKNYLT